MFFVYILYSKSRERFYVGMTQDIEQRLQSHNKAQVQSTKAFLPWELLHIEQYQTRILAREREKYLKSAAGRRWRKNNLGM